MRELFRNYFRPRLAATLAVLGLILAANLLTLIEPLIIKTVVDDAIGPGNLRLLAWLVAALMGVKVLGCGLTLLHRAIAVKIAASVFQRFNVDFFRHLLDLDLDLYYNTKLGEFLQRLGQDIYQVYQMLFEGLTSLISNSLLVLVISGYLFYLDPQLSLAVLVLVPACAWIRHYFGKHLRKSTESMLVNWGKVSSVQQETLSGIRLVKELNAQAAVLKEYQTLQDTVSKDFVAMDLAGRLSGSLTALVTQLGPVIILLVGGISVVRGHCTAGQLLGFAYLAAMVYAPVNAIVGAGLSIQRAKVGVERIYEYFAKVPKVADARDARELVSCKGQVEFRGVGFAYRESCPVITDMDFCIQPGQTVAFVGASGAGKSTIVNLLCRFYDPTHGTVAIDGTDIRELTQASLRRHIGIVSQGVILFHRSIRENLRLGQDDATDEQIAQACRLANIHEFIESLPQGYDTVVGERGAKISGGQGQRLAIARAILRNPAILIFDEATSHLDSNSERAIQESLAQLAKDRTTILIAHRLSTVVNADCIYVLAGGRIVEQGRHAELLAGATLYSQLWSHQFQQDRPDAAATDPVPAA